MEDEDTGAIGRQIDGVTAKIRQELHMTAQRFTAEEDLRDVYKRQVQAVWVY